MGQGYSPVFSRDLFPRTSQVDVRCSQGIYEINSGGFQIENLVINKYEREREREVSAVLGGRVGTRRDVVYYESIKR